MKVLFIVGKGRSGSTLLDIALNSIPGFFSTGELWRRWGGWTMEKYRCGCGQMVANCDIWSRVLAEAYATTEQRLGQQLTPEDVLALEQRVERWLRLPQIAASSWRTKPFHQDVRRLQLFSGALYDALASITQARVLVDSSKVPFLLGPMGMVEGVTPYIVHLVRDSRAVAFAWRQEKAFLPAGGPPMPMFGPVYSSISWNARNFVAGRLLKRHKRRSIRIRYEDFISSPKQILSRITAMLDLSPTELPLSNGTLDVLPNHTMWGNASRFQTGRIRLRSDTRWHEEMGAIDRLTVTALTAPLLHAYGYSLT